MGLFSEGRLQLMVQFFQFESSLRVLMPPVKILPADFHAHHVIQAMSCTGEVDGCYPSFSVASHHFLVAQKGQHIIGYLCAHPVKSANHSYLQIYTPYVYAAHSNQGIEGLLHDAMLKWGEEKCGLRFYKDPNDAIQPMRAHDLHQAHHEIAQDNPLPEPAPEIYHDEPEPVENYSSERIPAWSPESAYS